MAKIPDQFTYKNKVCEKFCKFTEGAAFVFGLIGGLEGARNSEDRMGDFYVRQKLKTPRDPREYAFNHNRPYATI